MGTWSTTILGSRKAICKKIKNKKQGLRSAFDFSIFLCLLDLNIETKIPKQKLIKDLLAKKCIHIINFFYSSFQATSKLITSVVYWSLLQKMFHHGLLSSSKQNFRFNQEFSQKQFSNCFKFNLEAGKRRKYFQIKTFIYFLPVFLISNWTNLLFLHFRIFIFS